MNKLNGTSDGTVQYRIAFIDDSIDENVFPSIADAAAYANRNYPSDCDWWIVQENARENAPARPIRSEREMRIEAIDAYPDGDILTRDAFSM